jgi:hypothetical protein
VVGLKQDNYSEVEVVVHCYYFRYFYLGKDSIEHPGLDRLVHQVHRWFLVHRLYLSVLAHQLVLHYLHHLGLHLDLTVLYHHQYQFHQLDLWHPFCQPAFRHHDQVFLWVLDFLEERVVLVDPSHPEYLVDHPVLAYHHDRWRLSYPEDLEVQQSQAVRADLVGNQYMGNR